MTTTPSSLSDARQLANEALKLDPRFAHVTIRCDDLRALAAVILSLADRVEKAERELAAMTEYRRLNNEALGDPQSAPPKPEEPDERA
jgi:hypothetical protein